MEETQTQDQLGQNQRMEKVFRNYLEMDTSYALLMNGPRGIGKTFFVKANVLPLIKKILVKYDQSKKYIPVYISLYGFKSIDEVYTSLALELMPLLKNKRVRIGLSVAKLISRGMLNYNRAGDIDLYKKDFSLIAKNTLETKDFVLIFDDLDRISSTLEVGEIIGFVNSLVEHDNNKIIIIGDDDQFKDNNNYTAVKEKTIGTVIEYATEMTDNYDLIIAARYKDNANAYYKYLLASKEDILHWFNLSETKSLRTLIYFLEHFYTIFGELYNGLKLEKSEHQKLGFRKLDAVLTFSVAITIEFKRGKLSYQNPKGIDDMKALNLIMSKRSIKKDLRDPSEVTNNNSDRKLRESFMEEFITVYFNNDYEFYRPVFNYITGGDAFELKPLLADLKRNFDDRIFIPSSQDEVYQMLSDPQVYNLTAEEYINLSDKLLAYGVEGKYPLERYIPILFYLQRFPDVKVYDMQTVATELIEGIRNNAKKFVYDDDLKNKFEPNEQRKNKNLFLELFKVVNEVNNSNRLIEVEKNRADLFIEFRDTPDQFYFKASELPEVPIFSHWDFKAFYAHFKTMPASEIPRFTRFLKKRYENPIRERLEYIFISALFDELCKHNGEKKELRNVAEHNLAELLKDIIERSPAFHGS
ncbi:hypothetical protein [Mucilaginibacter sp.]|uniref:hypothetical protein n=1 Tax=Mucilaginibacter sp. TaxID=1882438 RepID=UPI0035BC78AB